MFQFVPMPHPLSLCTFEKSLALTSLYDLPVGGWRQQQYLSKYYLIWIEPAQFFHPFPLHHVWRSSNHLGGSLLDALQQVSVFHVPGNTKLCTAPQKGYQKC